MAGMLEQLPGFLTGIVVVAVVAFFKKTWSAWLRSAFRNILAPRGADISGDYSAEYWELGEEQYDKSEVPSSVTVGQPSGKETITLQQRGRHISGRITRDIEGAGDQISSFTGECADRHITGTYKSIDPRNPERGSFCLKISNGGSTLRGGYIWYNTSEGKESIDYGLYVWKRK